MAFFSYDDGFAFRQMAFLLSNRCCCSPMMRTLCFSNGKTMCCEVQVVQSPPSEGRLLECAENRPLSHPEIWWCRKNVVPLHCVRWKAALGIAQASLALLSLVLSLHSWFRN